MARLIIKNKVMAFVVLIMSSQSFAVSEGSFDFKSVSSIGEMMDLPTVTICSKGGPSQEEVESVLLKDPMTISMYQDNPAATRFLVRQQSKKFMDNIHRKCEAGSGKTVRKLTVEMLKDKEAICKSGIPTVNEYIQLINDSSDMRKKIDSDLNSMPYEYKVLLSEGAKSKGMTLREVFVYDVAAKLAGGWDDYCSKNKEAKKTDEIISSESYIAADKMLGEVWGGLSKSDKKRILPEQRLWIKSKASCGNNYDCLTNMTNKRIIELKNESRK